MSDLAVYDLDRTITKRPTYTPFLIHCALRREQWRLVFVPVVVLAMLTYAMGLCDRGRLKEICQTLLIGHKVHARDLMPLAGSFADATVARNIRPGATKAIVFQLASLTDVPSSGTAPKGAGWSSRPPPTASTRMRSPSGWASTT